MMTKRIIFGVLLAAMIVIICSCNEDNAPSPASQGQPFRAVNPLPSNPQQGTVWENSIGMKLVWIPPGEFEMGSDDGESDEKPIHTVKISKGYYMGIYEVTQEQYQKVMSTNPSGFKGDDNLPVEQVSWEDAVEFCKKLSQKEGKTYRLPTEAEWEYACRAGTTTPFNTGATISTSAANYSSVLAYINGSKGVYLRKTAEVGSYRPNAFGLYDMHGNVWEWCADWYGEYYYSGSPSADPKGSSTGRRRVLRGGTWYGAPGGCGSANRHRSRPDNRGDAGAGFRIVLDSN